MRCTAGVGYRRLTEDGHRLGERVIEVIEALLTEAGVLFERVVPRDVRHRGLDAWVVAAQGPRRSCF